MVFSVLRFGSFCVQRLRTALAAYLLLFAINIAVALSTAFSGQQTDDAQAAPRAVVTIQQ